MKWHAHSDWRLSAKGNYWRNCNGVLIVVGKKKSTDEYWGLVDGKFLPDTYESLNDAKAATEAEVK